MTFLNAYNSYDISSWRCWKKIMHMLPPPPPPPCKLYWSVCLSADSI